MGGFTALKIGSFAVKHKGKIVAGIITFIALFFIIFSGTPDKSEEVGSTVGLPEEVMRWKPDVERIAKKNEIPEYVPIILAMIMVESGGKGSDILQSSESAGGNQNDIKDPIKSLEQGIGYLAGNVRKAKELGCDMWTAVGAYNFGSNYVNYISEHGKKHSTKLADSYSLNVVAPAQRKNGYLNAGTPYNYPNPIVIKYNGGILYLHSGNFFYVDRVQQYVDAGGGSNTAGKGEFKLPVKLPTTVTSGYGVRTDPITGSAGEFHKGIDFAGGGNPPIFASKEGTVIYAQFNTGGFGNYVAIQHNNGLISSYAHLNSINVKAGQQVKTGEQVGAMGTTGSSTGVHLHFAISKSLFSDYVDPSSYLKIKNQEGELK